MNKNIFLIYKSLFPSAESPLDYVATFGFEMIESLVKEAINKTKEIKFTTNKQKITFNL